MKELIAAVGVALACTSALAQQLDAYGRGVRAMNLSLD